MTITDLIDELSALVTQKCDAGSVQIRLAKIRLAAQNLETDNVNLRKWCDELQKSIHQETVRRNQTTELLKSQLPAETISTEPAAKKPALIKSRLKKPIPKKRTRKSRDHR